MHELDNDRIHEFYVKAMMRQGHSEEEAELLFDSLGEVEINDEGDYDYQPVILKVAVNEIKENCGGISTCLNI